MAANQNKTPQKPAVNYISLKDLYYLCRARWRWFLLSLAICLGVAFVYLLRTPKIYTGTATIMIKDDTKGKSATSDFEVFSDLGIFGTNQNVNNEIGIMHSPDLVRQVVSQLNLQTAYRIEGRFHDITLYGDSLPFTVAMPQIDDAESASFTLTMQKGGRFTISSIVRNGNESTATLTGTVGQTLKSPLGPLTVSAARPKAWKPGREIQVSRSSMKSAVAAVSGSLSLTRDDEKSAIIQLYYNDVSPQRAKDILATFIAVYNENWVKDKNQVAASTSMFINERLGVIENELGNVDNDISSFKSQNLLPDVQAAAGIYMNQASEAAAAVQKLSNQAYMARYIRNYLTNDANRSQLLPANSGLDNAAVTSQINAYNTQMLERNAMVAKSSEKNPLVQEMDNALAGLRSALVSSIDNEIVGLEAQIKSLQNSAGQATSQIASNPKQANYLLGVERQQKVKETLYLYLLQKREETELSQAFSAYNTRVVTQPDCSSVPTAPVSRNVLLIALILGLLIPVVIIFVRENTNTRLRGRKDLDGLSVPVVGEIPLHYKVRRRFGIPRKVNTDNNTLVVRAGNRNVVNEAFRVMRTNISFLSGKDAEHNVYVVTSMNPGSGKTFITMNTAMSFAVKHKRVLVIDGDIRRCSASAFVDTPAVGLSDYLAALTDDWRRFVTPHPECPDLFVLPVGTVPPNPTELLETGRLEPLVEAARREYDYVFIDCPPVQIVADAQILEQMADRTLFVVRVGLLERAQLPDIETMYKERRMKNISLVINCSSTIRGTYGYRYSYGYGYSSSYGGYTTD